MILAMRPNHLVLYPDLARRMFELRARVFCEQLGWANANLSMEVDFYDSMQPTYLVKTNSTMDKVYASGRLLPTNRPTLISDIFYDTIRDNEITSKSIWEVSRLCADTDIIRQEYPPQDRITPLRELYLAALEFALSNGIKAFVANFDNPRLRMWRKMGASFHVIGTSTAYYPYVHAGILYVRSADLEKERRKFGYSASLLESTFPS